MMDTSKGLDTVNWYGTITNQLLKLVKNNIQLKTKITITDQVLQLVYY